MKLNKKLILSPNSEYERREELSRLFLTNEKLTSKEVDIIELCTTEDHESIGLIGCILKNKTDINMARLIIASHNRSNITLASKAKELLSKTDNELELLINKLAEKFILNTDELTEYEDKIYYILFEVVK